MTNKVKIHYLFNSGFYLETETKILVFDYYLDTVDSGEKCKEKGVIGQADLKNPKDMVVFSSHNHHDHFNPVIFEWQKQKHNIHYILSNDIKVQPKENITFISEEQQITIDGLTIKAYGSTDLGVSFLINTGKLSIFHAGDLNWWDWYDATEDENNEMEELYKGIIEKIKGNTIDIAFVPVDSRLKSSYHLGADYFIKQLAPKVLVPMHFGKSFDTTSQFAKNHKYDNTIVYEIKKRGHEISLNL